MVELSISVNGLAEARSSIESFRSGWGKNVRWFVVVGAEYGAYVEYGTRNMSAQPYLFPATAKVLRTDMPRLEREAMRRSDPIDYITRELAVNIVREAKPRAPYETGYLRNSIHVSGSEAWSV